MPPDFIWNARALRYIAPSGRFVSRAEVRGAIDQALVNAERRIAGATEALRTGRLGLAPWERLMREEIKNVHLYNAAAARGGWAQMTQADYGRVGQAVRRQYEYLERFGNQIASGRVVPDGRFMMRARSYAQAGRSTYHMTDRRVHRERGFTEERSLLGIADHCDECVSEEGRGWVRIGDITPIGSRQCLSRCRCSIEYR